MTPWRYSPVGWQLTMGRMAIPIPTLHRIAMPAKTKTQRARKMQVHWIDQARRQRCYLSDHSVARRFGPGPS